MYRNTKSNLLYLRFPNGFLPKEVEEKYSVLLKQYQLPFRTVAEYINSLIVNISFPNMSYTSIQQDHKRGPRNFRPGTDVHREIDKNFTIEMRLTEGYISYFILMEIFIYWNENDNYQHQYLPDFIIKTLNLRGYEMATIKYSEVLFTGFGDLSLSFSEVDPSFNTFSLDFGANVIEINPLKKLDF